jgi:formate dehydrogenase iron-sulfur subunit
MDGKSFLIDTSRCMGCRSCQIACKSWNQKVASLPSNRGGHQNPIDLDGETFKLVRFSERPAETPGAAPAWYFFADQCRHCLVPECKDAIEGYVAGGVIQDAASGALVYTAKARQAVFADVRDTCPYDIPRQAADGRIVKCTMCIDRISNGLDPACVLACSSGALQFGGREEILKRGRARVQVLSQRYPKARLLDEDSVRTIFLVVDDPGRYHKNATADATRGMNRKLALRRLLRLALQGYTR